MKLRMKFNEQKATQAAALLLKLRRNNGVMSYMKLIKLLYLADREALIRWGRPITMDNFFSMDNGPVLSAVLDRINMGDGPGEKSFWSEHIEIFSAKDREVALIADPSDGKLSQAEDDLLHEIFCRYGEMSRWEIRDFVHTLPEWTHPNGSSIPIELQDILRSARKTPDEIDQIEQALLQYSELEAVRASS